jgi:hypothetical protein
MQHPNLLLQYTHKTLATSRWSIWNTLNILLQRAFSACNATLMLGRIMKHDVAAVHGARQCASRRGPTRRSGWAPARGAQAPLASICSVAWANAPWARQRTSLAQRWTEAPWGMAAATCQSGLARSAPECCASEVVARCAWLGQRASAGGGRRADKNEYVNKLIFLFRNGGAGRLGLASHDPPTVRMPVS